MHMGKKCSLYLQFSICCSNTPHRLTMHIHKYAIYTQ